MACRRAVLCAALLTLAACAAPAAPPAAVPSAPVTTGSAATALTHGDAARSGAVSEGPDPTSPAVAWRAGLDGPVYASPLIARGLVVAATEGGSLYGLDAATGATVWRTHVADPVPAGALPCGNITPTVGITGTPAYDAATGQVFAVAATQGLTAAETATETATASGLPKVVLTASGSRRLPARAAEPTFLNLSPSERMSIWVTFA